MATGKCMCEAEGRHSDCLGRYMRLKYLCPRCYLTRVGHHRTVCAACINEEQRREQRYQERKALDKESST